MLSATAVAQGNWVTFRPSPATAGAFFFLSHMQFSLHSVPCSKPNSATTHQRTFQTLPRRSLEMDHPFIHFSSEEGTVVINLLQVTRVTIPKGREDQVTLHTSDGVANTFHGEELAIRITNLIRQYTMDVKGKILPLANFDDELEELKKQEAQQT
jgi:hypothetical protein